MAITQTATVIVDASRMKNVHTGINVLFSKWDSGGTQLSASGVVVFGFVPRGAKIVQAIANASAAGGDIQIGLIGSGSTTTSLCLITAAGNATFQNSCVGYNVSASDQATLQGETIKGWAASAAYTGVVSLALEYVLDDASGI